MGKAKLQKTVSAKRGEHKKHAFLSVSQNHITIHGRMHKGKPAFHIFIVICHPPCRYCLPLCPTKVSPVPVGHPTNAVPPGRTGRASSRTLPARTCCRCCWGQRQFCCCRLSWMGPIFDAGPGEKSKKWTRVLLENGELLSEF